MDFFKSVLSNSYLLIAPILLWNIFLTKYLPSAYQKNSFHKNIPKLITVGELIGRIGVFVLPLFMKFDFSSPTGKLGLLLYIIGVVIYSCSWILLILYPHSIWSRSLIGFTAPAYTIIIWLIGFSLSVNEFYFNINFSKLYILISSVIMFIFHTSHAIFVWFREYN